MNTKIRTLIIVLISVISIFTFPIYSNAYLELPDDSISVGNLDTTGTTGSTGSTDTSGTLSVDSIFNGAKDFITQGSTSSAAGIDESKLQKVSKVISNILLTIAIAVTFISIAVMGVNFAIQTVEEKAKIKEAMVPWVIGIFISFGAYGIWKIVMKAFYSMNI